MPAASRLESLIWMWFSRPTHDRMIYRTIRRLRPVRIVQLGVDPGPRTFRMLRCAQRYSDAPLHYTGIDPFESRVDGTGMKLKDAYQRVGKLGIRARLLPGDPTHLLPQVANQLMGTDLILVDLCITEADLADTWLYWPRMLHEKSAVLLFQSDRYLHLSRSNIETRAAQSAPRRRAA